MAENGYVEAMVAEANRKTVRDWFLRLLGVVILVGVGMTAFYMWRVTHILDKGFSQTIAAVEIVAVVVENADTVAEKESICELDGGEVSWNARGNKVCDIEPNARDTDSKYQFDNGDWVIV
ncbi:MAG: hypothetical protein J4G11_07630 [Acidimicrobiia bacterium]|nr:hypothetical protein [Acidimicrobiia bacterium]